MKKKVTIISYSFPPANSPAAQRPYSIAKYIDKSTIQLNVLTCSNQDSSLGTSNEKINFKDFNVFAIPGLSLKYFRKWKSGYMISNYSKKKLNKGRVEKKGNNRVFFPDKAISWFPFALVWCLLNPEKLKNGTVLTTSPLVTNHLLGLIIKKLYPIHWIADIRDFYYLDNIQLFPQSIIKKMHHWLEKKILKNADHVTFISDSMMGRYSLQYPKFVEKYSVIYNGFDPDDYLELKDCEMEELGNLPIRIFYAGSFYDGIRSPTPLIFAIQKLIDRGILGINEIEIKIAGNFEMHLLREIVNLSVLERIFFLGTITRRETIKLMQRAHLLWLIVGEQTNHSATIPIKAFEYLGSGRPILYFGPKNTETANIIRELNAGWVLSNRSDSLEENLILLKKIIEDKKFLNYYTRSQNSLLNKYNRKNQAHQFQMLLK